MRLQTGFDNLKVNLLLFCGGEVPEGETSENLNCRKLI